MKDFRKIDWKKLGTYLLYIVLIIGISSISIHFLTSSETLDEYAQKKSGVYGNRAEEQAQAEQVSDQTDKGESAGSEIEISQNEADTDVELSSAKENTAKEKKSDGATKSSAKAASGAESESGAESASGETDSQGTDGASDTLTATSTAATPNAETAGDQGSAHRSNYNDAPMPDRVDYEDGFYYESLSEDLKERITGVSFPTQSAKITYEDLRHLGILYYDANGEVTEGELICNQSIVKDLIEIFFVLFQNEYRIERVELVDNYEGDDTASMLDNNTSCFNYREVEGSTNLSKHAYGRAIDINPFYNPYIVFGKGENGGDYISPKGSEPYIDRAADFPYKIDQNDLCFKLFKEHGFTWGGDWNSCKDYQHFQK